MTAVETSWDSVALREGIVDAEDKKTRSTTT